MSEVADLPRISRLSEALVNQIAAGEVIERPASVVKELMENSIDAGSDWIEIDIEQGGARLIRVRDNGHGIHPEDMPLALESHATSKVREAGDLIAIRSLGFRGEALSSIASVSRFELISRMAGSEHAWSVSLQPGSGPTEPVPAAHEQGTTVQVHDLFQTVPARRKFLRAERTEFLHILETVRRLALSRFNVGIRLQHNRRQVLLCRPVREDPDRRIGDIMGKAFLRDAAVLDSRRGGMQLWGRLGGPGQARNQSDRQYFYLNGRMIRDKRLNHAVRQALEGSIPPGRYPSYVMYLSLDPATTDVNVHPTKQEVRLRNVRDVHDFVHAAVNEAMQKRSGAGDQTDLAETGYGTGRIGEQAALERFPLREMATLYRSDRSGGAPAAGGAAAGGTPLTVLDRFILLARAEGVILLDGIEARRIVIRHRLMETLKGETLTCRPLLVPVMMAGDEETVGTVMQHQPLLAGLGLELEEAGPASLRIRSIPALLQQADIQSLYREIVPLLQQGEPGLRERVIDCLARHGGETSPLPDTDETLQRLLEALHEAGINLSGEPRPGLWRLLDERELMRLLNRHGVRDG